jgi:hypothetical protein
VTWVQQRSRLGRNNRTYAIAQVYLIGTLVLGSLGYELGPHLAAQIKNPNTAVPEILEGLSSGRAAASLGSRHGLSAAQQLRIQDMLVRHHDLIEHVFERSAASAAYVAARAIWLFAHLARSQRDQCARRPPAGVGWLRWTHGDQCFRGVLARRQEARLPQAVLESARAVELRGEKAPAIGTNRKVSVGFIGISSRHRPRFLHRNYDCKQTPIAGNPHIIFSEVREFTRKSRFHGSCVDVFSKA